MTTNMRRFWRRSAVLLTALAAALCTTARAADKRDAAPELDLIPSDGAVVVSFRVGELWNDPAFKAAREKVMKGDPHFTESFVKEIGVEPGEIERITGLILSIPSRGGWIGFITTTKPYDAKKLLDAVAPDAKVEKVKNHTLYVKNTNGQSIALLSERTFVIGAAEEVKELLNHAAGTQEGALTPALRAAGRHLVAGGVNVPVIAEAANDMPPQTAPFLPLLKARSAVFTADLGKKLMAEGKLDFAGESDAKAGEKAVNAALDLARGGLVMGLQQMGKQKETERFVALLEEVQSGIRAAKVERNGSSVAASATAKVDLAQSAPDLLEAIQKARSAATRMTSINNLKQLALAMYNYEATYNHFPSAAVYDKNGKPLLSWRVMVLPYIEQDALYKEFHLDEPWDSENNKKLLEKMPPLFAAGDEDALKKHETHYQTFVGKGSIFDNKKGVKIQDITDGTSNTIIIVEAKKAVPWTKPEDVSFDAGKLVPKLGGLFEGIFNVAFADGSVQSMPLTIK